MTAAEALRLIAKVEAAYRQSWSTETKTVYVERLLPLDAQVARAAIDEAIGEQKFPPSVSELLTYAEAVAAEAASREQVREIVRGELPPMPVESVNVWIAECERLLARADFIHYRPYVEAKLAALIKLRDSGGEMTPEVVRQMLADITASLGGDRRERAGSRR